MEIQDQEAFEVRQRFGHFLPKTVESAIDYLYERLVLFSPEPKNTVEGSAIVIDEQQKALPAPQEENE